ncbi:hypothetical protein KCP75_13250 [Salmonella enterica subsp. enterica]|nr:hypothetical protein KCP75_13250 [Salmonella enterica subsp. enterica]
MTNRRCCPGEEGRAGYQPLYHRAYRAPFYESAAGRVPARFKRTHHLKKERSRPTGRPLAALDVEALREQNYG